MHPRFRRGIAALAIVGILTTGCTATTTPSSTASTASTSGAVTVAAATAGATVAEALAANSDVTVTSAEYDAADAVTVQLAGSGATSSSDAVTSSGGTVTISAPGTFVLSGTLAGQLVVASDAAGAVRLVLDGVTITSDTGAAIAITKADEAAIVLAAGSVNRLTDAAAYADTTSEDAPNAALFSMADLTIAGTGSLEVTGRAFDGIASKDGVVITSGTVTVDAVDDGVRGKDYLRIDGGTLTVTSGGDALKSDNETDATAGWIGVLGGTVTVTAGVDGLDATTDIIVGDGVLTVASGDDALHAEIALTIGGGTIDVTRSVEGLESEVITISGGDIDVTSSDDAVNASAAGVTAASGAGGPQGDTASAGVAFIMTDGSLVLDSSGDGLDSNGDATISGGTVIINGPTANGNGALDVNGEFLVNGGTLVAFGSAGMVVAPSTASDQDWLAATGQGTAGEVQIVTDGQVLATYTASKPFASVVFSSSAVSGTGTYEIVAGGQSFAEVAANTFSGGGRGGMPGGRRRP